MKVIDLLSRIANSEPIPYRIKYNENIYHYDLVLEWYIREDLKNELFIDRHHLRDNIEIIEEPHKIPEKLRIGVSEYDEIQINNEIYGERQVREVAIKVNEIIDYLEENK